MTPKRATLTLALTLTLNLTLTQAQAQPLTGAEIKALVESDGSKDAERILKRRAHLNALITHMSTDPALSAPGEDGLLTRAQRDDLWSDWAATLDYLYSLESTRQTYRAYYKADEVPSMTEHTAFVIAHTAFMAQYAAVVRIARWIDIAPKAVKVALNEKVDELSIPERSLRDLRERFLTPSLAAEFAVKEVRLAYHTRKKKERIAAAEVFAALDADRALVRDYVDNDGVKLSLKSALSSLRQESFEFIFPVQAGISEWMGDTKIKHPASRISPAQIHALPPRLALGDVLLERREWYLSNIGLPGFWPHAALYVGTPADWSAFDADEGVRAWARQLGEPTGRFEALIKAHFPKAYARHLEPEGGHPRRVIEAMSEGVSHTSLEHSADCDSLMVLRPRVSLIDKARAVYRAFYYSGRPYDFDFDFLTDQSLVCTEVVQRAYEPAKSQEGVMEGGLELSTVPVMGRRVIPANHIARLFDEGYGGATPEGEAPASRLFELVLFLDGDAAGASAAEGDLASARASWRRPKWRWR